MLVKTTNDNITFFRVNYFNKCRFQLVNFININIRMWFIRYMNSHVEERAPSWRFSRHKLNDINFRLILVVREVSFVILVSLTAIRSNTLFADLSRWPRSSKLLFKEHALIWNKARDFYLLGNFKVWIWSML